MRIGYLLENVVIYIILAVCSDSLNGQCNEESEAAWAINLYWWTSAINYSKYNTLCQLERRPLVEASTHTLLIWVLDGHGWLHSSLK